MLAPKVRIALTSQLDIDTMSTELGLRRISWQRLHDKSHPHWDWHHNTFVFNVVCARNDFRDMIEGSSDALSIQDVRSMCVEKQGGQKIIYTMMKRSDSSEEDGPVSEECKTLLAQLEDKVDAADLAEVRKLLSRRCIR